MADLPTRLTEMMDAIHAAVKSSLDTLRGNIGNLANLNTTAKDTLVNAINEAATGGGVSIDDANPSGTTAYSGNKVETRLTEERTGLKAEILGGAQATWDTLQEIKDYADQLDADNDSAFNALVATVNNKANSADVYTKTEIGDPDTDLAAYWSAKGPL